jgi:hypothetical protein
MATRLMKLAMAKARSATARGKLPPVPAALTSSAAAAAEEAAAVLVDGVAPAPCAAVNISPRLMAVAWLAGPSPESPVRRLGRGSGWCRRISRAAYSACGWPRASLLLCKSKVVVSNVLIIYPNGSQVATEIAKSLLK